MNSRRAAWGGLVGPAAFPYRSPSGTTYDSGDYPGALAAVTAATDYASLRAEQALRRASDHSRHVRNFRLTHTVRDAAPLAFA